MQMLASNRIKQLENYIQKLDMSQLWWLQRNGRRRVGHNEQTDLSRFWVKGHKK